MKVTINLDLENEHDAYLYKIYNQAEGMVFVLQELLTDLRHILKHRDLSPKEYDIVESIRNNLIADIVDEQIDVTYTL